MAALLVGWAGCQSGKADPPPDPAPASPAAPVQTAAASAPGDAYRADIEALCASLERSGAMEHESTDRMYLQAQWLAANIKTTEAKAFMVKIQPLTGEPKAKALVDEAHRVGLADCALAAAWR